MTATPPQDAPNPPQPASPPEDDAARRNRTTFSAAGGRLAIAVPGMHPLRSPDDWWTS